MFVFLINFFYLYAYNGIYFKKCNNSSICQKISIEHNNLTVAYRRKKLDARNLIVHEELNASTFLDTNKF